MSYIFDALEQARRERHKDDLYSPCSVKVTEKKASTMPGALSDASTDARIVKIFAAFQEQFNEVGSVLQLLSAQGGEGVSFIAKRFARAVATSLNKKVLLVTLVTRSTEADQEVCDELKWQSLAKLIQEESSANGELNGGRVVAISLPFRSCFDQLKQDVSVINDLKMSCDVIILDTPSDAVEPTSVEIARYADAVIIVLEAERTKAFAVQSLKQKLEDNSGHILGIVLNKRCFHIPYILYSKLH